jgi:type VI secretion system protein ImpJ
MRNLAVHWSEGMFLRPHHFQAADRHVRELIATSSEWDAPYNYGLRSCQWSSEAIANYQVQVMNLSCRLRDGTIYSAGEELDRRNLRDAFQSAGEVTAYLGIPKSVLGRGNVAAQVGEGRTRYLSETVSLQDEAGGGNDQEVQLLRPNARVLLSTEELSGYEAIPIGRVRRAGAEEATPELDEYIPPLLAIDAWPPLSIGIVRAIYDIIGEKIEILGARVLERGITLASTDPGDLDDLLMLHSLNKSQAALHCLTFARGVHPLPVYSELCRIVGALSVFGPQRVVGEIPVYDHDDLSRIFRWVKLRIEQLLGSRKQLQYQQRYFVGTERGLQVEIDPPWLHSGWDWYVGVNGKNVSDRTVRELLQPGNLDWKMGSAQQVDVIFKHGVPGVRHIELASAPRALPGHQGWTYYEISREGNAWKDVFATQSLALRFRTELIGNLDQLRGQRNLEVILPAKRAVLQFALFAVPRNES